MKVLLGAAASFVLVSTAFGAEPVVVDRSIGPVHLGMRGEEVRATLGEPSRVLPSDLHGGWERWLYRKRRLTVTIGDGRVWDVRTRSARYQTGRGLRVRLREAQIRRRLPNARCRPYGGPPRYRRWRTCTTLKEGNRPFTRVLLIRGVARELRVARGLAL